MITYHQSAAYLLLQIIFNNWYTYAYIQIQTYFLHARKVNIIHHCITIHDRLSLQSLHFVLSDKTINPT